MSAAPNIELEQQLGELTTWHGPTPGLWRRAWCVASKPRQRRTWIPRLPGWLAIGAPAVAAVLIIAIVITLSSGPPIAGDASDGVRRFHYEYAEVTAPAAGVARGEALRTAITERYQGVTELGARDGAGLVTGDGPALLQSLAYVGPPTAGDVVLGQGYLAEGVDMAGRSAGACYFRGDAGAAARQVVRKASVDLLATDVRAAFLKASHLISEARGEYVQDSSLTGSDEHLEANLTLRVAAERLPEVLNQLRDLGQVQAERVGGEDVTAQVVDLEARLTNERRVEVELLELLEKRQDAPLKEVLELRQALSGVRGQIEQYTAQRERLGHLVSLATVLVIIRPVDAPTPAPTPPGLGGYLADAFRHAWNKGVRFLIGSVAGLVSVMVGGLIWWVLLIALLLVIRHYWRRGRVAS